jgi:uncharacterized protein
VTPVLVDTGFLISLFRPGRLSGAAARYIREHRHPLLTASPVVVETCFGLSNTQKCELLSWLGRGGMSVADLPAAAYPLVEHVLRKYADQELDLADAALVWLANESGARSILTVDRTDFSVLRLTGGRPLELIDWY